MSYEVVLSERASRDLDVAFAWYETNVPNVQRTGITGFSMD